MADDVDASELEFFEPAGVRIDSGGNSTLRWCRYGGRVHLFKQYTPEHLADVDETALRRLIDWRAGLPPAGMADLDRVTAWPTTIVHRGGRPAGVLTPPADTRFLTRTRSGAYVPRSLFHLAGADSGGRPPPAAFAVLGELIRAVRRLHGHGVMVNDLHQENVLYAVANGAAAVYLVDCDSMVSGRHWGRVASPAAPDLMNEVMPTVSIPTIATDLVKLKWIVVRTLLDVPNAVGLGERDRTTLADWARAASRQPLLDVLDAPQDGAAWDRLGDLWASLPAPDEPDRSHQPVPGPRAAPVLPDRQPLGRRRSWLPPGYDYRPAPGPPVLPPRMQATAISRAVVLARSLTVLVLAAGLLLAVLTGLQEGHL